MRNSYDKVFLNGFYSGMIIGAAIGVVLMMIANI
jgi:hypothetical protein